MAVKTPLFGLRNPFKFGLRGVGPSLPITPVLSDFGAGSIDDLELDPPAIFIEHNIGGTLTGDFHSSATPPAKEAGDIGFFTTSLSGDAVTDISTALNTFLDLHPGETGYLHFRLTNAAGDSNVITTQVITTSGYATVTGTTGSPTIHSDVDGDGLWDAYEFTASGSITLTAGKVGRRLWQGGGGSGASFVGGMGGGGGGWTEQDNTEPTISADTYTVTIGAGGAGVSGSGGNAGGTTSAMGTSAAGGGGGGAAGAAGGAGGNGGGASVDATGPRSGGTGSTGFNGGASDDAGVNTNRVGGGGGGSGGAGGNGAGVAEIAGSGGAGIDSDILGTTINFGAGGGGSARPPTLSTLPPTQGAAGGASASAGVNDANSSSATANRGGGSGGAGGSGRTSGNGGSGCFIIRIRR